LSVAVQLFVAGSTQALECDPCCDGAAQPSDVVAVALGFSNPLNYRRLVRGMFGAPPSVVRERGGVRYVARVVSGTHGAAGLARSQDA